MRAGFKGFPPEAMDFFRGLERHNHRDWFLAHKHIYEGAVKAPMVELVSALNAAMMEFAPAHVTDPARAIYRIYRDVRFSADKTPYKTNIAASFYRRATAKHEAAGYYFGIGAKEVQAGGGLYLPPPETLRSLRTHFAGHHDEFRRVAGTPALRRLVGEIQGERLARPPKGYAADHPAADLLRYKQCYFYVTLDPAMAATPRLFGELLKRFRAMAAFVDFLNVPLAGKRAGKRVPIETFQE